MRLVVLGISLAVSTVNSVVEYDGRQYVGFIGNVSGEDVLLSVDQSHLRAGPRIQILGALPPVDAGVVFAFYQIEFILPCADCFCTVELESAVGHLEVNFECICDTCFCDNVVNEGESSRGAVALGSGFGSGLGAGLHTCNIDAAVEPIVAAVRVGTEVNVV